MNGTAESLTIGALAEAADVTVEAVRFYQRKGLIDLPRRPPGSIRRYGPVHASRITFIKSAQRLGFSLQQVAELLRLQDGADCAQARAKASEKLTDVQSRLQDLQRIERTLTTLIERCDRAQGDDGCPFITALREPSRHA